MCLQVVRLVLQTLRRADLSRARRARLGAFPHGPCPSQSARRSSQSWLRMRSGRAGPLMAARTSTLPRPSWMSTRSTISRWVFHVFSACLLWVQSIFLLSLQPSRNPMPNTTFMNALHLAWLPTSCLVRCSTTYRVSASCFEQAASMSCCLNASGCSHYCIISPQGGCMLQVIVSEQGGPEETFLVRIKWAATVDIKSLTQFVA